MIELAIIESGAPSPVSEKFLKALLRFLEEALAERQILSNSDKELTIAFVSPSSMRSLNKKFFKKNRVTDVLSFSPLQKNSFGELALCGEKIKQQAKEHGLSAEEETAYLVLHGFLHLLGYHHEQGGESAKKMYQIQDEIFDKWQAFFHQNKSQRKR